MANNEVKKSVESGGFFKRIGGFFKGIGKYFKEVWAEVKQLT